MQKNKNENTPSPVMKIIPLGGMNEIGKNMTVFEYEDDIILVDAGISFPEDDMLGIDVVIPDLTYLEKNADKIRGVVFTHGHEDHIGAVPYLLGKVNVPLYGMKFTMKLIEKKLEEHKSIKAKLHVKSPRDKLKLGNFHIEFINVNHSIPDAVSLVIKTPAGVVIHTGDFKVDYTPIDGKRIDLNRFAYFGSKGVDLLLADSTNVEKDGYSMSESSVGYAIDEIFRNATSRIVVASFASNVHRIQQIVNAARITNRKVAFSGRSMNNVSNVALELGYLKFPAEDIVDISDISKYPDNEIVIITTGSQGEPMAALTRMAYKTHRQVELREGDLVVLSSSPIPGNEKSVKDIINRLFEIGVEVIYEKLADVHVSGHAYKEELKLIHSLVRPKQFVPVHGEFSHLKHHADLAETLGVSRKNIHILENGLTLEFSKDGSKIGKKVQSGHIMIDGLGVGDVGSIVLRDRKHLAEDGIIIVVCKLEKDSKAMISDPDIISRGFVYVKESEELMGGMRDIVKSSLLENQKLGVKEWSNIKLNIKQPLSKYIYSKTKRRPMIIPIIMEV